MIQRAMTQDKSIWLGTRIGRWFWFNGDPSHWFTQGCMVRYRGQWCVAQSLTSQRAPRSLRVRWWGRLGRLGRCHRY